VLQTDGSDELRRSMQEIVASIDAEHVQHDSLFTWKYRLPIFLAVTDRDVQSAFRESTRFCINLNDIFGFAGYSKVSADLQAVAVGATNLLSTMLAMSLIEPRGTQETPAHWVDRHDAVPGGSGRHFLTKRHEHLLLWLLIGYIAFCLFAGSGDLGVYQ